MASVVLMSAILPVFEKAFNVITDYRLAEITDHKSKLIGRLIRNSSRRGEIVLDTFGGSGSTMMAAEQLGRKCYTIEYDPHYCDVIIARWEKLTGKQAKKIN
jgi:16S rRNA G966 N2-methylase RsmD